VKYDKAAECLNKDRDALLTFYDFPAEHWKHLRTTDEMDKALFFVASKTLGNFSQVLLFDRAASVLPFSNRRR